MNCIKNPTRFGGDGGTRIGMLFDSIWFVLMIKNAYISMIF